MLNRVLKQALSMVPLYPAPLKAAPATSADAKAQWAVGVNGGGIRKAQLWVILAKPAALQPRGPTTPLPQPGLELCGF